jgi:Holliday junction resolvase RusA-like endonuclease
MVDRMSEPITITVPMVPPATLLANQRRKGKGGSSHWQQAADTLLVRSAARAAAIGITAVSTPVSITYEVHWPADRYKGKTRMPDCDAIPGCCKAILDGIVDAGVLADDSPDVVTFVGASQTRATRRGVVVVTIRPEEAAA